MNEELIQLTPTELTTRRQDYERQRSELIAKVSEIDLIIIELQKLIDLKANPDKY